MEYRLSVVRGWVEARSRVGIGCNPHREELLLCSICGGNGQAILIECHQSA